MTARSVYQAIGRAAGGVHLAAGALVLLFLVAAIHQGARYGFVPDLERYGRTSFDAVQNGRVMVSNLLEQAAPENIGITVWGLAERPGGEVSEDADGIILARMFADAGMQVRVHDPHGLEQAREILGDRVYYRDSPVAAAAGGHVLVLACEEPEYERVDWADLVVRMYAPRALFDCHGALDGDALQETGFRYFDYGMPTWPFWLDPELGPFLETLPGRLEGLGAREPADTRILLLPANLQDPQAYALTSAPRSRFFLALNYALLPRRLYMVDPVRASGTVPQYQDWVIRTQETPKFEYPQLLQASRETGAEFVLLFRINQQFSRDEWHLGTLRLEQEGGR